MIKIAILGPESTGKTALSQQLAQHYQSQWIPEYARAYVEQLQSHYSFEDVCTIAHHQIEVENALKDTPSTNRFIFFDTELIITKVWFEYCYKQVPAFVLDHMQQPFFDLYLLCQTDISWEPDTVREHGTDRDFFFDWYLREIEQTGIPYVIVSGIGDQRLQNAIQAIESFIKK